MMRTLYFSFLMMLLCLSPQVNAENGDNNEDILTAEQQDVIDACLSIAVTTAGPDQTVEELRNKCIEENRGLVEERVTLEKSVRDNPFAILPHRPTYVLPISYSQLNEDVYGDQLQGDGFDDVEIKFQVSFKFIVVEDMFYDGLDLQLAYTSVSWWQAYNKELSSAFRETNYEPEVIFAYTRPWSLLSVPIRYSFLSLNHQSNGRGGSLSRSWNRIVGGLAFEHKNIAWLVKVWWRIPEDERENPGDTIGDDNPDIEEYLGNGQLGMVWQLARNHNLELMLRNNLRSDNKGAIELGWTYPFATHFRGYVQYFNGYGESLIYYNVRSERLSFGIKFTDWL